MKVRVIATQYGVDVYANASFVGGVTRDRMDSGPLDVAEAVRCILDNISHEMTFATGETFEVSALEVAR